MYLVYNLNDYLRDRKIEMIDSEEHEPSNSLAWAEALGKLAASFYTGAKSVTDSEDEALLVLREWLAMQVGDEFEDDGEEE